MPAESEKVEIKETSQPTEGAGEKVTSGKKSTQIEILKRLTVIEELITRGVSQIAICKYARKEWDISDSQVYRYMAEVRKAWLKIEATRAKDSIAEATRRRHQLYRMATDKGDMRTALAVDDSLRKLQGVMVNNVRILGGEGDKERERKALAHLSEEELAKVGELQEKAVNGDGNPVRLDPCDAKGE